MHINSTQPSVPNHNWASVQLNLIMLPVGLSVLLIVSLSACICHFLRKRRLKKIAREYRRQQRSSKPKTEGDYNFAYFSQSPTRCSSVVTPRDHSMSPTHPATLRKEKIKRKREKRLRPSENGEEIPRRKVSITSVRPDYSSGDSKNSLQGKARNGKVPERRRSGIPVPIKSKVRIKTENREILVKNGPTNSWTVSTVPEPRPYTVGARPPYTIDMETLKTQHKDRRKWVIPDTPRVEYDRKGLRLPPLSELRLAKTA